MTRRHLVAAVAVAVLATVSTATVARSDGIDRCLSKAKTEAEKQECRWMNRGNG